MKKLLTRLVREDEGQDLIEYALLAAFVALLCIAGMQTLSSAINSAFSNVASQLPGGGS
jgi:pilus assembly protein Flp/PilA